MKQMLKLSVNPNAMKYTCRVYNYCSVLRSEALESGNNLQGHGAV